LPKKHKKGCGDKRLYFAIFCVNLCVGKLENCSAFVEYVVSCMGMMLFEIILCENGSRGYFAKLENAINFWI
jgi:hypothetical protein